MDRSGGVDGRRTGAGDAAPALGSARATAVRAGLLIRDCSTLAVGDVVDVLDVARRHGGDHRRAPTGDRGERVGEQARMVTAAHPTVTESATELPS
ncbi:hypothetical protein AB0K49_14420 [Streptomyces decoyicus]|uniref:hypothetical protein n=1 Tax=Streptomyces decoyicus TaxID=249567 RepID=UPI00345D9C6C